MSIEQLREMRCPRCGAILTRKDQSDPFLSCEGKKVLGFFFMKHPAYLVTAQFLYVRDGKLNDSGSDDKISGTGA